MSNKITFTTQDNQTKATFDYENLQDVQVDAIKKVLGITPSGTINITENGDHDVTNYATASVEVEGGPQPTLFPPVVTGGVNEVSWANDTSNGGFVVTLIADVDGTTVTSPLTITQEMDGKTLTITASATNFNSASQVITLSYIAPGETSLVSPTGYTPDASYPYTYLRIFNVSAMSICTYNGTDYQTQGISNSFYIPIDLTKNETLSLTFTNNLAANVYIPGFVFGKTNQEIQDVYSDQNEQQLGLNRITFTTAAVSILNLNEETVKTGNASNNDYIYINQSVPTGTYHFIINVTF